MEMTSAKKSNHGSNVRRWREWKGINQDVLAEQIGISQGTLSSYENKEKLEPEVIGKIAKALDIPTEAITDVNEGTYINIFSGTFDNYSSQNQHQHQHINSLDKVVELYERLLKSEQDKIVLLQEVLKDKK